MPEKDKEKDFFLLFKTIHSFINNATVYAPCAWKGRKNGVLHRDNMMQKRVNVYHLETARWAYLFMSVGGSKVYVGPPCIVGINILLGWFYHKWSAETLPFTNGINIYFLWDQISSWGLRVSFISRFKRGWKSQKILM